MNSIEPRVQRIIEAECFGRSPLSIDHCVAWEKREEEVGGETCRARLPPLVSRMFGDQADRLS